MGKKTNPRKIPRTQEDCDRSYDKGVDEGCAIACAIFLTVLVDKFNGADYIRDVWGEVLKLSEEIKERRVSVPDLRHVLLEEYKIEV